MPMPVSLNASITYCPSAASAWLAAWSTVTSTLAASTKDLSGGRNRIARVDCKINEDLFHLPTVGFDGPQVERQAEVHDDVFADQSLKQTAGRGDYVVQVDQDRLQELRPAERQ